MSEQWGFLSYTRKDDQFFGGYISTFRKKLEEAVHVVTGDLSFRLFQDVEGIVLGENWEKKLSEVITKTSFLVPMMTPLFFNSEFCRDEVALFLEHEKELGRDDMILPVYFLSSAKLEKEDERNKDPLAKTLAERQRADWRDMADTPLDQPGALKAILKLANSFAEAIQQVETPVAPQVQSPLTARGRASPRRSGRPPGPPVPPEVLEQAKLPRLPRLGAGASAVLSRERVAERTVLWVDDTPSNNDWERRALAPYGVRFLLAQDTDEAERLQAKEGPFAAIISDMGRLGDNQAGYTLLDRLRKAGVKTPYFIYTSLFSAKNPGIAKALGAQGITADPDELAAMVVSALT